MKIRMIENKYWRGGLLIKGDEYNMPTPSCQILIDNGHAEVVTAPELAAVAPVETAVPEKPQRRTNANPSKKRKKNG